MWALISRLGTSVQYKHEENMEFRKHATNNKCFVPERQILLFTGPQLTAGSHRQSRVCSLHAPPLWLRPSF